MIGRRESRLRRRPVLARRKRLAQHQPLVLLTNACATQLRSATYRRQRERHGRSALLRALKTHIQGLHVGRSALQPDYQNPQLRALALQQEVGRHGLMHGQPTSARAHAAAAQQRCCYSAVSRGSLCGASVEPPDGRPKRTEAHLCERQEGAVHRRSGWCSVDLFRGSRRRGSSYAAGADIPGYLVFRYPDAPPPYPGISRIRFS